MDNISEKQQTIFGAFRKMAGERSDQLMVAGGQSSLTFGELDRITDSVAGSLAERGVAPRDRVGLYCTNTPEFAIVYLAILKAGATVVPLNLMHNPKEVAFILQDAGAKAIFFHEKLSAAAAQILEAVPAIELAIQIGGEGGKNPTLEMFSTAGSTPPEPVLDATTDLAAILYTSGTTGRPKGAMLSHRNLMADSTSVMQALKFEPGQERILVVLPLFHAFAATVGLVTPLAHGLTMIVVDRFEPKHVTENIDTHGATTFLGVPSMFNVLLRLDKEGIKKWQTVNFCVSGGAAMPVAIMEAFQERFGIPILEGDGPTECGPVTCVNPPEGPHKAASVGLPLPGIEMRIAGPDGETLANGEHGEVCVRGPNVMLGYLGLEEATRESFFDDWFRTGDLGHQDDDGYFYLVDRIKDLIITNGMNVYPRMIEECLYRHPEVADAAVVGEPHHMHGEIPIAYVVLTEGSTIDSVELRNWCKEYLGRHEIPRRIEFKPALPRNAAGKILKRELRREGELERGVDNLPSD